MKKKYIVGILCVVAACLIGWGGYEAYASTGTKSQSNTLVFSIPSTPPTMNSESMLILIVRLW